MQTYNIGVLYIAYSKAAQNSVIPAHSERRERDWLEPMPYWLVDVLGDPSQMQYMVLGCYYTGSCSFFH